MKLIADSGSTKTDWCLISAGQEVCKFVTEGYNPFFVDSKYIFDSLGNSIPQFIDTSKISDVVFYGAGCQDEKKVLVTNALEQFFRGAALQVEVDLLAAARGLLHRNAGFVAILGTGTNTCTYDGVQIDQQIESLGFLMGDEGSGSYMGRKILSDYIRGRMPEAAQKLFYQEYKKTPAVIMDEVYSTPLPNRYCANYVLFLNHPEMDKAYSEGVIRDSFHDFFENLVSAYPDFRTLIFNCVGSVGYYYADTLRETADAFGMQTGAIVPNLIDHLVAYHLHDN
ncbi:N-acetylglucosamine kinase [Dyadobacter sp. CY343]|uniref:N-acetylglucosamine kinase n=1 Tax=Dyadobacter sp. CY343 TaxID=2907299 RepID=UPI001F1EF991|nr:N-acetylglucosamine kinase [Dyadobacter sp. CY343]MCE7059393.1 N-acetylglucosamine kinase [Dyadobacter sp. CY343]